MRTRRCPDCPSVLTDRPSMSAATRLHWHRVHAHGYEGTPPPAAVPRSPSDHVDVDALIVELEDLIAQARERRTAARHEESRALVADLLGDAIHDSVLPGVA